MSITLQTKNLTKHFGGVYAVDKLSVAFERVKITGVIGPNGSGKSTLINVLTGLVPLDDGTVVISGVRLNKIKPHETLAYGLTRTFQEIRLFAQLSVLENVLLVLTERNVWGALFEKHQTYHLEQVETALKKVDLWEKRQELAADLSYGQRKLLEIARALALKAEVYLLDEPFAGLFPEMAKKVADILQELRRAERTVILVEHNMELIRELADYVMVMDSGALLAEGAPQEVLERREVVEAYLGE